MSNEFNQALRLDSEAAEVLRDNKTPEPVAAAEAMQTIAASNQVITKEIKATVRIYNWIAGIAVGGFLLYLILVVSKRLL